MPQVRSMVSWPLHAQPIHSHFQLDFSLYQGGGWEREGPLCMVGKETLSPSLLWHLILSPLSVKETFFIHPYRVPGRRPGGYTHVDHWSFSFLSMGQGVCCGPCFQAHSLGSLFFSWPSHCCSPTPSLVSHRHHWPTLPGQNLPLPS